MQLNNEVTSTKDVIVRHTSTCGDPLLWFPMRVTYHREAAIKAYLDSIGVESYLPMCYTFEGKAEKRRRVLVPAIHNLIFVHSTRKRLTELKTTRAELLPLRYMMHHSSNGDFREIMVVPDKQMEDFIRISSIHDDRVMLLEYNDYLRHVGKRVRIIEGQFAGVEGAIKRIKNNRRVVVQIEGIAAVAITYVPTRALAFL